MGHFGDIEVNDSLMAQGTRFVYSSHSQRLCFGILPGDREKEGVSLSYQEIHEGIYVYDIFLVPNASVSTSADCNYNFTMRGRGLNLYLFYQIKEKIEYT